MAPRLGEPGQVLALEAFRGDAVRMVADASGLFWPATAEQVSLCDRAGLPVVHDDELPAILAAADDPADARTVAELREAAASLGVDVPKGARRADLLTLVQAAEAAAATPDDAGGDAEQED